MAVDQDELKEWAYEAVRGSVEWLADLRRAADLEGFEPYGDGLTDYEGGFVSVSEGLTTISLVRRHERETGFDLGTGRLPDELYERDLDWLLTEIEEDRYRGTPYLSADDTDNFTDGVSFATSVLLEAAADSSHDIDAARIERGLEKNLNWLLDNAHNEHLESDHHLGWSWCGHQEMEERDDFYPPQTYFTWSGCLALVDVMEQSQSFGNGYRSRIVETLQRVNDFLLEGYRVDPGWIEFEPVGGYEPVGYEAIDPRPSLLSTCYTVSALCYTARNVPEVELDDEGLEVIEATMQDYVLDRLEEAVGDVYKHSSSYKCRRGGDQYYDGATPYTILTTLINYRKTAGVSDERVQLMERELAERILSECWGGTRGNREAGFRHFANPSEVESSENPTVVYATELGVESLLDYGIEAPDAPSLENQVVEELRRAEENILTILQRDGVASESASGNTGTVHEIEEMNRNVVERRDDLARAFEQQFTGLWSTVSRKLPGEITQQIANAPMAPKDAHVDDFLSLLLDRCFFEGTPDAFFSELERFRKDWVGFLVLPYKEALEELQGMDGEDVRNAKKRKQGINRVLDRLADDLTLGYSEDEIAEDLQSNFD